MDKYFYIIIGVILFLGIYYIRSNNKIKNKSIALAKDRLDLTIKLDLEYIEILDKLIMDTFDDYRVLHLAYDDSYINKDKEEQILKEVSDLVSERLSSTFIKQLSLYYNPNIIPKVVSEKIYLVVMRYVVEHNQPRAK